MASVSPVTGAEPEAGAPEYDLEALESAFRVWWGRNSYALEDGGSGDLIGLVEALNAAKVNLPSASGEAPRASRSALASADTERARVTNSLSE